MPLKGKSSTGELIMPDDADFMYLGSSGNLPQQISYSSSTTGILGQTSDTAVFVDGATGAVMNTNVSAERVNPVRFKGNWSQKTSTIYEVGDMFRVDSSTPITIQDTLFAPTRLIVWTGEQFVNADSYPPLYSNKKFIEKLMEMRTKIQMMDNAYVLYIYNLSQTSKYIEGKNASLESFRNRNHGINAVPFKAFVFINSFDITLDMDSPNQISVSIDLIQRNALKGYNE